LTVHLFSHFESMKQIFVLFMFSFVTADENSIGKCSFSRDCQQYITCQRIQDAGCICNFGSCIISGNPFFRGSECDDYTDCACKDNKEACFCKNGFCKETRYECHESTDCKKLTKCSGKDCACSGFLCEFDCNNEEDCKDFHCNTALGYRCKCEKSLCEYEQKEKECKTITDCISKGFCVSDKPCACTQDYCTKPWWIQTRDETPNCRNDQECEEIIAECAGGKCTCADFVRVTDWENRGTCKTKEEKCDSKRKDSSSKIVFPKEEELGINVKDKTDELPVYKF